MALLPAREQMTIPKAFKRRKQEVPSDRRAPSPQGPYPREKQDGARQTSFGAQVSRRAADRLRAGHVWVYASDLESLELAGTEAPSLLPVADYRGVLLGTALYSPASQIALRLVSREAITEGEWLELLGKRLVDAIDRRMPEWPSKEPKSDSYRLCFSEADEIPGLVVDKYADLVIVQLLTKGLDSAAVREKVVSVLRKRINPATILERPDPRIRELEGMSAPSLEPLYAADPKNPVTATEFQLNGLKFHYDANAGQKTGAFLDQRANYKAAADWASILSPGGRALDVCTYQGGFALHLARVSGRVTGIDSSRASLEVAERNLAANRDELRADEVDWVEGDAFQVLRDWAVGERAVRHRRARSPGVCQEQASRGRRAARVQGAEPARHADAQTPWAAGNVLMLAPRLVVGVRSGSSLGCSRCPPPGASAGSAWSSAGSSCGAQHSGDGVSEVPHPGSRINGRDSRLQLQLSAVLPGHHARKNRQRRQLVASRLGEFGAAGTV